MGGGEGWGGVGGWGGGGVGVWGGGCVGVWVCVCWCVVCGVWCVACGVWCVVCVVCAVCAVCGVWCVVWGWGGAVRGARGWEVVCLCFYVSSSCMLIIVLTGAIGIL